MSGLGPQKLGIRDEQTCLFGCEVCPVLGKENGVGKLIRHVTQYRRDRFGECVIHCVASLLFDDWTLRVQSLDVQSTGEGVEDDRQKE